jgi:DNA-binding NtrC family response regulator
MGEAGPEKGKGNILIVDDDLDTRQTMEAFLSREGYEVRCAPNGETALIFAREDPPELVLLDVRLPDLDGFQICRRLREGSGTGRIPVIFISALNEMVDKVKGFAAGGMDYVTKPFQSEELLARIETHLDLKRAKEALQKAHDNLEARVQERTADLARVTEQLQERLQEIEQLKQRLEGENIYLQKEIQSLTEHTEIVGQSPGMRKVLAQAEQVSLTESTVLLLGETGTGKELLARAIHSMSGRKTQSLMTVNCASLPPTLIESELFGRERGAYTGALTKMVGRFEVADGSTLFLDEIGELSLDLQSKLLRVLEEGKFERLGSTKTLRTDVRIIAATNRDLAREVKEGKFRKDLYYRLNVFPIEIPPLRERREDIPLLVWAFVREFQKRMGKEIESIPRKSLDLLQTYPWPGNVRELKNVIERAMIVSSGKTLTVQIPKPAFLETEDNLSLKDTERRHILDVLERAGWRVAGKSGAAEILGLNRSTLLSKMKKLGIRRPRL